LRSGSQGPAVDDRRIVFVVNGKLAVVDTGLKSDV
jgi:hypothetical protein